jgi:3-deoxy-D-arabino-heptulosonate 7-phosphate (DAHP) synthase
MAGAVAASAHGLLIAVHDHPERRSLTGPEPLPDQFDHLMDELKVIAPMLGRNLPLARHELTRARHPR